MLRAMPAPSLFYFFNGEKHRGPRDELCVTVGSLAPEGLSAGGLGGGRAPAEGLEAMRHLQVQAIGLPMSELLLGLCAQSSHLPNLQCFAKDLSGWKSARYS